MPENINLNFLQTFILLNVEEAISNLEAEYVDGAPAKKVFVHMLLKHETKIDQYLLGDIEQAVYLALDIKVMQGKLFVNNAGKYERNYA